MQRLLKSNFAIAICFMALPSLHAQAQAAKELKDAFFKLMLAFPSEFSSIKGAAAGYKGDSSSFYTKVSIPGTKYSRLERNEKTGRMEYTANIEADDDIAYKEFQKMYNEWKLKIAAIDFNGAPLVPYESTKYTTEDIYHLYAEAQAWRLKTDGLDIDPQYKNFTIRLELMDLDQGGFLLQIMVSE